MWKFPVASCGNHLKLNDFNVVYLSYLEFNGSKRKHGALYRHMERNQFSTLCGAPYLMCFAQTKHKINKERQKDGLAQAGAMEICATLCSARANPLLLNKDLSFL